jgi:hypothetical protein
MGKYRTVTGQNLFDVALHVYGSIEGIVDLMMNNTALSLDSRLKAGDELEFTDGFVINPDITAYYRMNGITPANGERNVYFKRPSFPETVRIPVSNKKPSAGFSISGNGEMEIDWGDNSPLEQLKLSGSLQSFSHFFDSTVSGNRRITVYGDFSVQQLDVTDLQALSIFLFRPLAVEKFILKDTAAAIDFLPLLKGVYDINLSGIKTASLLPLVENRELMRLDLSGINTKREVLDGYLTALVKHYYTRRNCTVILGEHPSGEYRQPPKDENGNYLLSSGMEALWVLCNEPAWNEAGYWKFIISGQVFSSPRNS